MTLAPAVLLLATARSGSSLAVNLIGGHPELFAAPELRLFHVETVRELLDDRLPSVRATQRLSGLLRALAHLTEGAQTTQSIERAFRWLEDQAAMTTVELFRHVQGLAAPRLVVEKSPETVRSDEAIRRAFSVHPKSEIIHLVRHPWTTVASMVEAWRGLSYWNVTRDHAHQHCAEVWLTQNHRIHDAVRRLARHRRMRIEDLTQPTPRDLEAFCREFGLDHGAAALAAMQSPERSPFARPGPTNATAGLDAAFIRSPALRPVGCPASLDPPPNWRLHSGTVRQVQALAQTLGYGPGLTRPNPRHWRSSAL